MPEIYLGETHTDSIMNANAFGPFDSLRMAYVDSVSLRNHYESELVLADNLLRFWNGYADSRDTTGTSGLYEAYLRSTYTLSSKKLLAEWLLQKESIANAEAVLDTVWLLSEPGDSLETYWFGRYIELMIELAEDSFDLDSSRLAQMYAIAESGAHVAPKAHAVLHLIYNSGFEYPIEKIDYQSLKKAPVQENNELLPPIADSVNPGFKLYPNPNDGKWALEYELIEEHGQFTLYDITGRPLFTLPLMKGSHKIPVEHNELRSGMYLYGIRSAKGYLFNGRIIIIK
ncbi:MAG TPA: T9SS type A sorting domain-containing protein [Flavobacterium sp.]|nr:T9SS type A sorting domain-containing protein [Flavobacterium sp.]